MHTGRVLNLSLLALSVSLAGCTTPQSATAPFQSAQRHGAVDYYASVHGSLTIKVLDMRRQVQALGYADSFNGVLFKLTNTAKLKQPMVAATAATSGTYSMVFSNLPSDSTANYSLVAGLYRGVGTDPTNVNDAAYSTLDDKVGEGGSANFTLNPGESKTITIVINAVGAMTFSSTVYVLDDSTPVFESGDTSITLTSAGLSTSHNPQGSVMRAYFVDAGSNTVTSATASIPARGSGTIGLLVPTVTGTSAQNFTLFTELASGSTVFSRRQRTVTVEPTSSVTVDTSGGAEG